MVYGPRSTVHGKCSLSFASTFLWHETLVTVER
jgi:hypothetical protein